VVTTEMNNASLADNNQRKRRAQRNFILLHSVFILLLYLVLTLTNTQDETSATQISKSQKTNHITLTKDEKTSSLNQMMTNLDIDHTEIKSRSLRNQIGIVVYPNITGFHSVDTGAMISAITN